MTLDQLPLVPLAGPLERGRPLVAVRIHGQPARAKHACTCRGGHPGTRPDDSWKAWRAGAVPGLRAWWAGQDPITGPVVAQVVAVFQRPKAPRRRYTLGGVERPYPYPWTSDRVPYVGTPDWDQVGKAGVDVLVKAGILLDDPLVVDASTPRWYTAVGESPSVEVRLWAA